MKVSYSNKNNEKLKRRFSFNINMNSAINIIGLCILTVILGLMIYAPFVQGLYFEKNIIPVAILVFSLFIVFAVCKLIKKEYSLFKTPAHYMAFFLVLVYALSVFWAVGVRQAIAESLKYAMYFILFIMVYDLSGTPARRSALQWAAVASGVVISIIGLDAMAGEHIVKLINALLKSAGSEFKLFALYGNGRIFSTFQYPNTTAAFLAACVFISLGITMVSPRLWQRLTASVAGLIMLIAFIITQSRGAYLLIPVAFIIYLLLLPAQFKASGFLNLAFLGAVSALLAYKMLSDASAGIKLQNLILYITAAVIVNALLYVLGGLISRPLSRLHMKFVVAILAGFVIIGAAFGAYLINQTEPLLLSNVKSNKDQSVSLTKSVKLNPGDSYTLKYTVKADNQASKPYAYRIEIASKNEKNVLVGSKTVVTSFNGNTSNGQEERKIEFSVPKDSEIVEILFLNYYKGTGAEFSKASIENTSKNKVSNLVLKYKYIPQSIVTRLEQGITGSKSGMERLCFYKDGLEIFKDHWLAGAGGGAWALLYFSYQSFYYSSTQAHNFPLQLAVETGALGILMFAAFMLCLLIVMLRIIKKRRELDPQLICLQASSFTAMIFLLLHACIDFDFSMAAPFMLFWIVSAVFMREAAGEGMLIDNKLNLYCLKVFQKALNFKKKYIPFLAPVIMIVVSIIGVTMFGCFRQAEKWSGLAEKAVKSQNYDVAASYYKNAISNDAYSPKNFIGYASAVTANKQITKQQYQTAQEYIKSAEKLAEFDATQQAKIASYYFITAQLDKGFLHIDRSTMLRPLRKEAWQEKIDAYTQLTLAYARKGDTKNAELYMGKTLDIINQVKEVNKQNLSPFTFTKASFEMLEKLVYLKEKVNYKVDSINKLAFYSINTMDIDGNGIPDQWTSTSGDLDLKSQNNMLNVSNKAADNKAAYIQSRSIFIRTGGAYRIIAELENPSSVKQIPFTVTGVNKASGNLTNANGVFTAEFTVPTDFKPSESNYLRLGITGSYNIKSLMIVEK